jgi:two-component system alkaline phosphatase synthesis response regulator PhoP
MAKLLVIEDNAGIAEGIKLNLELEGHQVKIAGTGEDGLKLLERWGADLLVLDVMLPGADGFQVLRLLRERGDVSPVLLLTARGAEADRVRGFRLGADDYVTKPFSLPELLARVEAILRRAKGNVAAVPDHWTFGDVRIDAGTREVTKGGAPVALRPREFDLLLALVRREGRVISRADLLEEVWRYEKDVVSRTVDSHILELRRKLEADPAVPVHLLTVRKTGYRLLGGQVEGR